MELQKIQNFTQNALKAGYSIKEINGFIEQQQKEERAQAEKAKSEAEKAQKEAAEQAEKTRKAQEAIRGAKEGFLSPEEAIRMGASVEDIKVTGAKQRLSEEEKKRNVKFQDLESSLNLLEKNLEEAETRGPLAGRLGTFISGLTGGAHYREVADYEALRKGLIGPVARAISGEVGVLTDKDIARAENLLPKVSDDPQLARQKIENLRQLIAERLGKEYKTPVSAIQTPTPKKAPQGISGPEKVGGVLGEVLFPRVERVAEKYGAKEPIGLGDIIPAVAEVGLTALPLPIGKLAKVPALGRFLTGMVGRGAITGGIYGATEPGDLTLEQRTKETERGVLGGALMGGVLGGAGTIKSKVGASARGFVSSLFKPTQSALSEFRRNTGLDFAEEVIKRDLPSIQGKGGQQILEYYTEKVQEFNNAADNFLFSVKKTLDRRQLLDVVNEELRELVPQKGRVLQEAGRNVLTELQDEISSLPRRVDLVTINQIKRDLQTRAQSAFGPSGSPSPASNALATIQRKFNNLLEKEAPGIKGVNKSVQFYHLARESIQNRLDQMAKSEGGIVSQLLTSGAGAGAVYGLSTGRPEIAALSGIPALLNYLQKTPRVKTTGAEVAGKIGQWQLPEILKRYLLMQGGRAGTSF